MVDRLDISKDDFAAKFDDLLGAKREMSQDVDQTVREIIGNVIAHGDKAVMDYTSRYDRLDLTNESLAVSSADIEQALSEVDQETFAALALARDRIEAHHMRQKPKDDRYIDPIGVELGSRWTAIESVGLYVPGGTAS